MRILATSDLDFPGALQTFWTLLQKEQEPDLMLFAGDMYEFKEKEQYKTILDYIEKAKWKCPIVAVFGNKEFDQDHEYLKKLCGSRVIFLNDETLILEVAGKQVGIVGTRGCIDVPTFWQAKTTPNIADVYRKRLENVTGQLMNLRALQVPVRILMSHYAATYLTLRGEDPKVYGGLGCKGFEEVIRKTEPTFVIHGHAHYGTPQAKVGDVTIYNVALPLNKRFVEIGGEKRGLEMFTR